MGTGKARPSVRTSSKPIARPGAAGAPTRSVDLERREDRYIVFVRDTRELMDEFAKHTKLLAFPNTPVTRTVYFGDTARGLPPAVSIKARTYERERLPGRWDLTQLSEFDLLEIKRTVEVDRSALPQARRPNRSKGKKVKKGRDEMVEILRLSRSILDRAALKSKQRKPLISMRELLDIVTNPIKVAHKLDEQLYVHLLESVHPLADYRWRPLIGTEYERTHFVTKSAALSDVFRATLDKRVTHYAFEGLADNGDEFVGVPVGTEAFSRLEIKTDYERIAKTKLGRWLEKVIDEFRAFRIPSKKFRGLTLRSQYLLARNGLLTEEPGYRLYTFFPSRPVRYRDHEHYVNLARYIMSSATFRIFDDDPHLFEEHEYYVRGRYRGLRVTIAGSELVFDRPTLGEVVDKVPIYTDDVTPVSRIPLVSRHDLDRADIEKMKKRESRYVRWRGFLVQHRKSQRVYIVALERHIQVNAQVQYFVRIEYVGRSGSRPRFDAESAIVKDICLLSRFLRKDPLLKPQ